MRRAVVRGFGHKVTHLADIPEAAICDQQWAFFGEPLRTAPAVPAQMAVCGQQIMSFSEPKAAEVMADDTQVTCSACRRAARRAATG